MKDGRIGRMGLKSEKEGFLGIWLLLLGFAGITAAVLWLHFAWDAKLYSLIGKELEPEEVLEVVGGVAETVNEDACIACGDCLEECPMGAITEIVED